MEIQFVLPGPQIEARDEPRDVTPSRVERANGTQPAHQRAVVDSFRRKRGFDRS
jgi:hypothetical protein